MPFSGSVISIILIIIGTILLVYERKIDKQLVEENPDEEKDYQKIIGCLAVIVFIPLIVLFAAINYADYSPRMAVNEGFYIAYSIQPKIEEYYEMHGSFPSSNYDVGISSPSLLQGKNVESVTISEGGIITILYKEQERGKKYGVGGHTIIIKPQLNNETISWNCKSETMPRRLHPCE